MAAVFQVKRYMMQCKKYVATAVSWTCFVYMTFINLLKLALNYKNKKRKKLPAFTTRMLRPSWSRAQVDLLWMGLWSLMGPEVLKPMMARDMGSLGRRTWKPAGSEAWVGREQRPWIWKPFECLWYPLCFQHVSHWAGHPLLRIST